MEGWMNEWSGSIYTQRAVQELLVGREG